MHSSSRPSSSASPPNEKASPAAEPLTAALDEAEAIACAFGDPAVAAAVDVARKVDSADAIASCHALAGVVVCLGNAQSVLAHGFQATCAFLSEAADDMIMEADVDEYKTERAWVGRVARAMASIAAIIEVIDTNNQLDQLVAP